MVMDEITKHKINVILAYTIGITMCIILIFVMTVIIMTAFETVLH